MTEAVSENQTDNALKAWRLRHGLKPGAVAKRLKISVVSLWRYENDQRFPTPVVGLRIHNETEGAVRVDYLARKLVAEEVAA
ncbi:helix-turn-helix domain-containing protein [Salipiger pacificus]|nr:helix-turn-helix domain-containing protein [Alloyangia pacifica]